MMANYRVFGAEMQAIAGFDLQYVPMKNYTESG
jgi:hypothetical protein